jgi:ATP adenylyltransferase
MKQIWSPWRLEYFEESQKSNNKSKKPKCFLCVKNSKTSNNFVLFRGKYSYIMLNRYPYNSGHLMVVPLRHIGAIEKLTAQETSEMFSLVQKSVVVLKKVFKPDGFNIGANIGKVAGAGVPGHIHLHVVPRWSGDTNFMPVVGDTKIINDSLNRVYNKLKKQLDSMGK